MNNVQTFRDTMSLIDNNEKLHKLTMDAVPKTKVYAENFHSDLKEKTNETTFDVKVIVSLMEARELLKKYKKVAVHSFANPIEPGGGVMMGAVAREEYLCRVSNLYSFLTSPRAADFYDVHQQLYKGADVEEKFLASDLVTYCPGVTVIKKDLYGGKEVEYTDDWVTVDVISASAPYFKEKLPEREHDDSVKQLYIKRIKNIFESAIDNDVEALVMGTFGCGAFNNFSSTVASAFHEVLSEPRYKGAFKHITFAIRDRYKPCDNLAAFEEIFLSK
ncbi:MAG: TIGR02452 family protein [Clostridia bacterium]